MVQLALLLCMFGLNYILVVSAGLITEAIIGGENTKKGEFKYQITLQFADQHLCGGCILDDYHILTAAHCVKDDKGNIKVHPYIVVAGTDDFADNHAIVRVAESVFAHKKFTFHTYNYDIAILKLKQGLNLSSHSHQIEKINLPEPDRNYDGVDAVVSGFGFTEIRVRKDKHGNEVEYGGNTDGKLMHARVKVIPYKKCVKMNKPQEITTTMICGQIHQRFIHKHKGACDGDSGGPLVHKKVVIGILSTSPVGCNESHRTSTYTRVSSYVSLIRSVLNVKPNLQELDFAYVSAH